MTRHDMTSNGRKEGWKGKARKGEGMEMLRRKRKGGTEWKRSELKCDKDEWSRESNFEN